MNNMYDILEKFNKLAGPVSETREVYERYDRVQETDDEEGSEHDDQYQGIDDPDRKRERKLRATDHKTLDRLERQAVDRAKQVDEGVDSDLRSWALAEFEDILRIAEQGEDATDNIVDELGDYFEDVQDSGDRDLKKAYRLVRNLVDADPEKQAAGAKKAIAMLQHNEGNEFTGELAKAKATGAKEFEVDGQTYPVKESEVDEGKHDPHPLDDPITRFRKMFAPSVMRDPEARGELSKLDTEYGERKKTAYGRGEEEDEDDEDSGKKKAKPAGEKRGRGRPKGTKRRIGAKGPTGRSKLLTRKEGIEEDYDQDEYDEEGEMAKTDARTIEDAAEELQSILDDQENLPEWVQKKISLAKDYVDRARDYMKANRPEDDGEEMSLPEGAGSEFTQADWNRVVGLKRMLMRMNRKLEPEDAEQKAAEKLGYDYEDVLAWIESDQNLEEKAVSKAQRKAAGIAYAAKKGDIPRSELRGASKEMAKMAGGELKKFAKTKEKGLPEKKDESMEEEAKPDYIDIDRDGDRTEPMKKAAREKDEDKVDETTTSGSVATGGDAPKGKNGIFGRGIYEAAFEAEMQRIEESMSVNISDSTESSPTVTVTASDEEAAALMSLLQMAGLSTQGTASGSCSTCGGVHEGSCEMVDEQAANSADNTETMSMEYMLNRLSGGVNGPKQQVNPNNMGDNPLAMKGLGTKASPNLNLGAVAEQVERELETRLTELYRRTR